MTIFERAFGTDFARLHPRVRQRLNLGTATGIGMLGHGVMDRIWRGPVYTAPFLRLGTTRHILFPEQGENVPFTIENYPYVDSFGRETISFVRTFDLPGKRRRFDAQMVFDPTCGRIVDYLGTHQHVATELRLKVREDGGFRISSGEFRLREGPLRTVLPARVSGTATVDEWFDEEIGQFRIQVEVTNPRFGPVFGYHGRFAASFVEPGVSGAVKPLREKVLW
ncbi:DUF4166 domain-containing protein [Amycolatopsis sp. 195334CR]|uniref:DUF4166 domain-containing protein n=1 Tax=Amycolatopsis sp. 195334CR TaxID=2814588 RepID=UPI001A8CE6D8|nr:DUF4166 domain-containing protein [Amycolatopsis sp. 195334CR]MBN6038669.1 DUF4166 domain-containing protein [Amycolatopsis sp. 195334CR]